MMAPYGEHLQHYVMENFDQDLDIFNDWVFLIMSNMFFYMLKYLLSDETKQIYSIYNRQAFEASILRLFHQVYEKMLNYMNKYLYLPKVVPLKQGC